MGKTESERGLNQDLELKRPSEYPLSFAVLCTFNSYMVMTDRDRLKYVTSCTSW
jgi:hypothetical protein